MRGTPHTFTLDFDSEPDFDLEKKKIYPVFKIALKPQGFFTCNFNYYEEYLKIP